MPPRTTFALADRQKDSCLHPSRPKRNIIQKEKAGNAPSLAHEKGHRQTHRQTTTTLIASGPPLRGDPYFVCISTTLLRNDVMFRQIDGVAMGSPLGPVLANIFVGYCESLIPSYSYPPLYCRFMDDSFAYFSSV